MGLFQELGIGSRSWALTGFQYPLEERRLLNACSGDEHSQIVGAGVSGVQEETVPLATIAQRGPDHDFVVMKGHFHLAPLRLLGEFSAFDQRRVAAELAHEEERFEL